MRIYFQENPNQGKKRNALERKRAKTDIADTDEVPSSDEVYIYDLSNFCWELLEKDAQLSSKEFVRIEYILITLNLLSFAFVF